MLKKIAQHMDGHVSSRQLQLQMTHQLRACMVAAFKRNLTEVVKLCNLELGNAYAQFT